ncbi:MAG TPA: phosphatidylglycerophosphatase A [Methylomirabilota bacterium]|jgi:phosphatidylglycerophosphatase A|nr:phosphatidylglycerophosphatase A [Methylomirabilota bacterium]
MSTFYQRAALFFATGAGVGYIPKAPGTMGTLLAIPLSLALNDIAAGRLLVGVMILIGAVFCAIWLSSLAASVFMEKDPQRIVIDEIVGYLVANFLTPPHLSAVLWSFFLFRLFDIVKIFPANRLEKLPGGAGIVLDDVASGIYAFISVHLLLRAGWV